MQNTKTMETRHRTCNRCRQSLPLSEFHRDRTLRAGRRYICGTCAAKAARRSELARYRATNGLSSTWRSMLRRCLNPRHKSYPQYGGRGISVCCEWKNGFDDFFQWAQMSGHQPGLQLDRIDNDGPYAPVNCRWVTPAVNMQNSTNAKLHASEVLTIRSMLADGRSQREIGNRFGISQSSVSRIKTGGTWGNAF